MGFTKTALERTDFLVGVKNAIGDIEKIINMTINLLQKSTIANTKMKMILNTRKGQVVKKNNA